MNRSIILAALALALSACAETGTETETAASASAGIDIDTIAACVRENATEAEIEVMGAGGTPASDASAAVLARAETQACLSEKGIEIAGIGS